MSQLIINLIHSAREDVEQRLDLYLEKRAPEPLWEAMRYSVFNGGKRVRPLLCLAACHSVSGDWQRALPAACAVELIHAYSLIHDDLPALDNDDWRRGKPSSHKQFGEAMAILAGDGLQSLAFQVVAEHGPLSLLQELAEATGPLGMCGGQVLDMHHEARSPEAILHVYRLKTGALIRAAIRMGAQVGGASPHQLQALTTYAESLGQAFQVVDDLLDLTGSFDTLGKTPGKDVAQEKVTYPAAVGVAQAQALVEQNYTFALEQLHRGDLKETHWLEDLAERLVKRHT